MNKPLKIIFIIVIVLILLSSSLYAAGYSKLKNEYQKIYLNCWKNLPEISTSDNNQNIYNQQCIDNGGCYLGCGSVCGVYKSSGYTFSESLSSLLPLGCTSQCKSVCLYP